MYFTLIWSHWNKSPKTVIKTQSVTNRCEKELTWVRTIYFCNSSGCWWLGSPAWAGTPPQTSCLATDAIKYSFQYSDHRGSLFSLEGEIKQQRRGKRFKLEPEILCEHDGAELSSVSGLISNKWIALVLMNPPNHGKLLDECHCHSSLLKGMFCFMKTAGWRSHLDTGSCHKKKVKLLQIRSDHFCTLKDFPTNMAGSGCWIQQLRNRKTWVLKTII